MRTLSRLILFVLLVFPFASATNAVYIGQSSAGANDGTSCANQKAASYFNSAGNWSATPSGIQIGLDTTVHLCGTFTGTAGQAMLTTQGPGTSGHQVVITLETGAVFTAPYWGTNDGTNPNGGAITLNNDYITLDGGTNGLITNTQSGSGLTYNGVSSPITAAVVIGTGCTTTCEVKNLNITNMFVKTPYANTDGWTVNPVGIFQMSPTVATSHILIHNNTISNSGSDITLQYKTGTDYQIYSNTLSRACADIVVADGGNNTTLDTFLVHDNEMFDNYPWWDPSDNCHINGMHAWAVHTGTAITNAKIYNNYVHDNMTAGCGVANCYSHSTSLIFLEGSSGSITAPKIFNNLFIVATADAGMANGLISCQNICPNPIIVNNTIIGNGTQQGAYPQGATGVTFKNNIVSNFALLFYQQTGSLTAINFNLYNSWGTGWQEGGTTYSTLAAWRTATGDEANSTTGAPNLSAGYIPLLGSPAIGLGTNLTSLSIAELDTGAPQSFGATGTCGTGCVARPGSGAWDAGAYQFIPGGPAPAPQFAFKNVTPFCTTLPASGRKICCSGMTGSFSKPLPAALNLVAGYPGTFTMTGCRNDRRAQ